MRVNVDHVLERDQRLQELDQRAHELGQSSYEFNEWLSGRSRRQSSWCSLRDYCIETIKTGFKKVFGGGQERELELEEYPPSMREQPTSRWSRSRSQEEHSPYRSSEESSSNRSVLRSLCDYSIRPVKAVALLIATPATILGTAALCGYFGTLVGNEWVSESLAKREVNAVCGVVAPIVVGIGGGLAGIAAGALYGPYCEYRLVRTALEGGDLREEVDNLFDFDND